MKVIFKILVVCFSIVILGCADGNMEYKDIVFDQDQDTLLDNGDGDKSDQLGGGSEGDGEGDDEGEGDDDPTSTAGLMDNHVQINGEIDKSSAFEFVQIITRSDCAPFCFVTETPGSISQQVKSLSKKNFGNNNNNENKIAGAFLNTNPLVEVNNDASGGREVGAILQEEDVEYIYCYWEHENQDEDILSLEPHSSNKFYCEFIDDDGAFSFKIERKDRFFSVILLALIDNEYIESLELETPYVFIDYVNYKNSDMLSNSIRIPQDEEVKVLDLGFITNAQQVASLSKVRAIDIPSEEIEQIVGVDDSVDPWVAFHQPAIRDIDGHRYTIGDFMCSFLVELPVEVDGSDFMIASGTLLYHPAFEDDFSDTGCLVESAADAVEGGKFKDKDGIKYGPFVINN